MKRMLPRSLVQSCFLAALACFSVGCGSPVTSARVEGNVSAGGKAVTGGLIRFYAADGRSIGGFIDPTGRYQISDAPLGASKVTVTTSHLKGAADSKRNTAMDKLSSVPDNAPESQDGGKPVYVEIDSSYESADTTTLTATVKSGDNSIDFSLD